MSLEPVLNAGIMPLIPVFGSIGSKPARSATSATVRPELSIARATASCSAVPASVMPAAHQADQAPMAWRQAVMVRWPAPFRDTEDSPIRRDYASTHANRLVQ